MITIEQWNAAEAHLREAATILNEGEKLSKIQLMAAFRRGIKQIEEFKAEMSAFEGNEHG